MRTASRQGGLPPFYQFSQKLMPASIMSGSSTAIHHAHELEDVIKQLSKGG